MAALGGRVRLRVLWFGRPAGSPFEAEVERYRQRVSHRWPAEDFPLRPAPRSAPVDTALAEEAAAVRRALPDRWRLVALDQRGSSTSSESFARELAELETAACPGLAFLVGSDLGLDPTLRAGADRCLSLSAMTLPHLLARLLAWEQLYRATQILSGGGYHRHVVQ